MSMESPTGTAFQALKMGDVTKAISYMGNGKKRMYLLSQVAGSTPENFFTECILATRNMSSRMSAYMKASLKTECGVALGGFSILTGSHTRERSKMTYTMVRAC